MMIPFGVLINPIEELEGIPENRWNVNDLERLEKLCKKVSDIISAKKRNHKEWIEKYSIKNIRKEETDDDSINEKS